MSASPEQVQNAQQIARVFAAIQQHDEICPCRHLSNYICRECQTLRQELDQLQGANPQ